MIGIVDYGAGNLYSIKRALDYLNISSFVTGDPEKIIKADGVILPGVGAFPDAMERIRESGMKDALYEVVMDEKPLLGICLGMQMLFCEGEEVKVEEGLKLIKGRVEYMNVPLKVPHMGWNDITIRENSPLLKGINNGSYFYFVHSYYANTQSEYINAVCSYGMDVPAVVSRANVFGVQFHPEKSGEAGFKILKNFWELIN